MRQITPLNRVGTMESDMYRIVVKTYRYTPSQQEIFYHKSQVRAFEPTEIRFIYFGNGLSLVPKREDITRKLKLSKYSDSNQCRKRTMHSQAEQSEDRGQSCMVNNKGEDHGAKVS